MDRGDAANDNPEPTDVSQPGVWHGYSADHVRTAFRRHNATNPWPERFEGVAIGVRPPQHRRARIISHIALKPRDREFVRAPCNICLTRHKCEKHSILILDEIGHLYLVGSVCAAAHFPDGEFNQWEREFQAEQKLDEAFEYMLRVTPQIPDWIEAVEALLPIEKEMTTAHRQLWRACPDLMARLARSVTDAGLVVDDVEMRIRADGKSVPRRFHRRVAHFTGKPVLFEKSTLHPRLKNALVALQRARSKDDTDLLQMIHNGMADGSLLKMRKLLSEALQDVREVSDELKQHRAFYSAANFAALRAWNSDRSGPQRFAFILKDTMRSISSPGENMFKVRFETIGTPIRDLPAG